MKARIKFRKYGVMMFVGHLDLLRYFQKTMRRAKIPVAYTNGYSPHMILSFAQPLPVGMTSDGEYLDLELTRGINSKEAVDKMNAILVEGMEVLDLVQIPEEKKSSGMAITQAADYRVTLLVSPKSSEETLPIPDSYEKGITDFLNCPSLMVEKHTKRSTAEVDIRPLIYAMKITDNSIYMRLACGSKKNLKPELVMETLLHTMSISSEDVPIHCHRLDLFAEKDGEFIPLIALGNEIKM